MTNQQMTIEIEAHQEVLLNEFAEIILEGGVEQAVDAFSIIFDRAPEDEQELSIFKALCESKIDEQNNGTGIQGVFTNGEYRVK